MTIIPTQLGKEIAEHAKNSKLEKLAIYLKLRDFYEENEEKIKITGVMQFYKEAGDWMKGTPAKTVQDYLGIIRNYPEHKLVYWLESGLSFNHIATANWLQNQQDAKYWEAEPYLNDAINLGNGEGNVMTVEEMRTYGLGEKHPLGKMYNINRTFDKWVTEIPTQQGWNGDKRMAFKEYLADVKRNIAERFFNE